MKENTLRRKELMIDFKLLLSKFGISISGNDVVASYGDGHINDTYSKMQHVL